MGLWGALCLAAAFYGNWLGNGGRTLAFTVATLAILLGGELWLASPAIRESAVRVSGPQGGTLVALWPLAAYLLYAVGTGSIGISLGGSRVAMAAAYALVPLLLAATAHDAKPGAWQDYAAMLAIFLPFKLGWLNRIFPGAAALRLGYALPLLLAINVALAAFVFVRRLDGIGYSIGWRLRWMGIALLSFALIAAADIPAGIALHFIRFDPHAARWSTVPLALLGTFVFIAWPEEFLFRGLLQNSLRKSLRGENAGWIAASLLFGAAHIANGFFPNWKYAVLAAVAGLGYGFAWRKTGSIFPGALVHMTVDVTWHLLFPGA